MGSWLTVTNDRQNEVWWILEQHHKKCILGITIPLGIIIGVGTGGLVGVLIGGAVATSAAAAAAAVAVEEVAVAAVVATEVVIGGSIGAAVGGFVVGGITGGVGAITLEQREEAFTEEMMNEQRTILEFNDQYTSKKHTLSLLRKMTAKRFDAINGKFYEISFNAWSGATADSIKKYKLSDYAEREIRADTIDRTQQDFLRENTKTDLCIHCQNAYPEYVVVPCGHKCFCQECQEFYNENDRRRTCPVCRGNIQMVMKVR